MNVQKLINDFLNSNIAEMIGWLLLNSLWQILILAIVYSIFKFFVISPRVRYLCGVSLMFLLATSVVVTWAIKPNTNKTLASANEVIPHPSPSAARTNLEDSPLVVLENDSVSAQESVKTSSSIDGISSPVAKPETTALSDVVSVGKTDKEPGIAGVTFLGKNWLRKYLSYLVLAWIVGLVLFSIRPIIGIVYAARIRKVGASSIDAAIHKRFDEMSKTSGIRQTIKLIQSKLVKAPMVVGYFRPIIVLPVAVATQFSVAEVDAILRHELAHIRRHDMLINFVQSILETVFFFHPSIWWISNQIRIEREHCCDDIAAKDPAEAIQLANALFRLEESRIVPMAVSATDGDLQSRIRRLGVKKQKTNTPVRLRLPTIIIASLLVLAISITAFANHKSVANNNDFGNAKTITLKNVGDSFSWKVLRVTEPNQITEIQNHFTGFDQSERGADPAGYEINVQITFINSVEKKIVIGVNTDLGLWNRGNGDFLMRDRLKFLDKLTKLAGDQENKNQKKPDSPQATRVKVKGTPSPVEIEFDNATGTMIYKGKAEAVKQFGDLMKKYLEIQKSQTQKNQTKSDSKENLKLLTARKSLANAETKLEYTKQLYKKGYVNKQQLQADELEVQKNQALVESIQQEIFRSVKREAEAAERRKNQSIIDREIHMTKIVVAEAELANAKTEYERTKKLVHQKTVPQSELSKAQLHMERKKSELEILMLQLRKLELDLKAMNENPANHNSAQRSKNPNNKNAFDSTGNKPLPKVKEKKIVQMLDLQILEAELEYAKSALKIAIQKLESAKQQQPNGVTSTSALAKATLEVKRLEADLNILHLRYKKTQDLLNSPNDSSTNRKLATNNGLPSEKAPSRDREIVMVELQYAKEQLRFAHEQLEIVSQQFKAGQVSQLKMVEARQGVILAEKNLRLLEIELKSLTPKKNTTPKKSASSQVSPKTSSTKPTIDELKRFLVQIKTVNESWVFPSSTEAETPLFADLKRGKDVVKTKEYKQSELRPVLVSPLATVLSGVPKVNYHDVQHNGNTIRISYSLPEMFRYSAGNGIDGVYSGYYRANVMYGLIEIDRRTKQILRHDLGEIKETFSDYEFVHGTSYAPKTIKIKKGNSEFDWRFQIVDGAWLLHEIQSQKLTVKISKTSRFILFFRKMTNPNPSLTMSAEILKGDADYMAANIYIKNHSKFPQTIWQRPATEGNGIFVSALNAKGQKIEMAPSTQYSFSTGDEKLLEVFEARYDEHVIEPGGQIKIHHRFSTKDLWPESENDLPAKVKFSFFNPPMESNWLTVQKPMPALTTLPEFGKSVNGFSARIRSRSEVNVRDQLEVFIQIKNVTQKAKYLPTNFHVLIGGERVYTWKAETAQLIKPGEDYQTIFKLDHKVKLPKNKNIKLLVEDNESSKNSEIWSNEFKIRFFQTW